MDDKRKLEIYEKALDWIAESSSSRSDLYNILNGVLGMRDDEILEEHFSSLSDFMDFEKNLKINAFISHERNSLVISLPTDAMNLGTKLSSIGVGLRDPLLITDEEDSSIRIKLMTENNTGCHLIKLFGVKDTLRDVIETIQRIMNSPDEIWNELRNRLVVDQYSDHKQLLEDVSELTQQVGEYKSSFFFPLTGSLDDGCGNTDDISNRYLLFFKDEIEELVEKEQNDDVNNMKEYFDEDDNARAKMVTAKWGITEINGVLYGKVDFRLREPFTPEEKEIVREWITGQNSDGFGEGLEQREIETEDGDLYVSMWNFSDDYFVYDETEMAAYLAGQRFSGGISQ